MKKTFITLAAFLIVILSGIFIYSKLTSQKNSYPKDETPTFYLHGYSGTSNSTKSMIKYAEKSSGAHKVFTATVDGSGKVKLDGEWKKGTDKPLIQVVFEDNKNGDFPVVSTWFTNVLEAVQKEHNFEQFYTVAHSMGNTVLNYSYLNNLNNDQYPKLVKEVALAAPFNGSLGEGYDEDGGIDSNGKPTIPNTNYKFFQSKMNDIPKNQLQVLNIFGNLNDGTNSDGAVPVDSAKSYRYLVENKAKSYEEVEIKGSKAQHSALHENSEVDKLISDFLWKPEN